MRNKQVWIAVLGTAVVGLLLAVTLYYYFEWQDARESKAAFLAEYPGVMTRGIRAYVKSYGEMPQHPSELHHGEDSIRPGWVQYAVIEHGFDQPSLEAGWTALEEQFFAEAQGYCLERLPQWQQEFETARAPFLALDGDLAAQLNLLIDMRVDVLGAEPLFRELREVHHVNVPAMIQFKSAYEGVRSVVSQNNPSKDPTLMLSAEELLGLEAVDLRLINGMQEFEEARQRVLDQLDK